MNFKPFGQRMHTSIKHKNGIVYYVSYETVIGFAVGVMCYKTLKKYSSTTTKHMTSMEAVMPTVPLRCADNIFRARLAAAEGQTARQVAEIVYGHTMPQVLNVPIRYACDDLKEKGLDDISETLLSLEVVT